MSFNGCLALKNIQNVNRPVSFCSFTNNLLQFEIIKKAFKNQIKPLYGSQEYALSKILENKDRTTEILFDESNPIGSKAVGIIIYKNLLQNEFENKNIKNSLEIKTLIVINPKENSNNGYGTLLLNRILDIAKEKLAENIHVTVSSKATTSLDFFKKKGFKITEEWKDKYIKGDTEYLLNFNL